MKSNTFGELLKSLRIARNWSQEEACEGICDRRTYIRWEKNESIPSNYNLHLLSNHFNYDLNAYFKFFMIHESFSTWDLEMKAEKLITEQNWQSLYDLILEMEQVPFFQNGPYAGLIYYYKAIYYNAYCNDYNATIEQCLLGLKKENSNFSLEHLTAPIHSNVGLCILNYLAYTFIKIEQREQAQAIYIYLLDSIDNKLIPEITYYQSSEFEYKLYQTVAYNLALNFKYSKDYSSALFYVDKGIQFSINHDIIFQLADLLKVKYQLEYHLKKYELAANSLKQCVSLYQLKNDTEAVNQCISSVASEYSKLNDML